MSRSLKQIIVDCLFINGLLYSIIYMFYDVNTPSLILEFTMFMRIILFSFLGIYVCFNENKKHHFNISQYSSVIKDFLYNFGLKTVMLIFMWVIYLTYNMGHDFIALYDTIKINFFDMTEINHQFPHQSPLWIDFLYFSIIEDFALIAYIILYIVYSGTKCVLRKNQI